MVGAINPRAGSKPAPYKLYKLNQISSFYNIPKEKLWFNPALIYSSNGEKILGASVIKEFFKENISVNLDVLRKSLDNYGEKGNELVDLLIKNSNGNISRNEEASFVNAEFLILMKTSEQTELETKAIQSYELYRQKGYIFDTELKKMKLKDNSEKMLVRYLRLMKIEIKSEKEKKYLKKLNVDESVKEILENIVREGIFNKTIELRLIEDVINPLEPEQKNKIYFELDKILERNKVSIVHNGRPIYSEDNDPSSGTNQNNKKEICGMSCIDLYNREVEKYPLLSPDEEKELGKIILKGGAFAEEAKTKLVNHNLRFAMSQAVTWKKIHYDVAFEDLIQYANLGLIEAAEKFNCHDGRFTTIATWWIRQKINFEVGEKEHQIKRPSHASDSLNKIKKAKDFLTNELQREPTFEEIAEKTGIKVQKVREYDVFKDPVSIDATVRDDTDAYLSHTISRDFLHPDRSLGIPHIEGIKNASESHLTKLLSKLSEKERMVIEMRFGMNERGRVYTLEEIGVHPYFNVSRERIRQIEARTIVKMQKMMHLKETKKINLKNRCYKNNNQKDNNQENKDQENEQHKK